MRQKYKVLIAEDEPKILAGIKKYVERWGKADEFIEEALNGKEALEKTYASLPDIIISDIRMPDMDGIEMLEEIRKAGLKTKVIFCSGYAEFGYAKDALRLGVSEYLLKPIEREKLWKTLDAIAEALDDEEQKLASLEEKSRKIEAICEFLWAGSEMSFGQFEEKTGMEFSKDKFQILVAEGSMEKSSKWSEKETIYGECPRGRYCRISLGKNKTVLLLNSAEAVSKKELQRITEDILGIQVRGGSSHCASREDRVSICMEEAEAALLTAEFMEDKRILAYKNADEKVNSYKKRLLEGILEGDAKKSSAVVEYLWGMMQKEELMITHIIDLYNSLLSVLWEKDTRYNQYEKVDINYIREILHTKSEFYDLFMQLFKKDEIADFKHNEMTIHQVLRDIEQYYKEEMALNDLSQKYHISISYLSTMIKKETSCTFTEYITNLRIEDAKELLAQENISVSEVAEMVGYNDYFYFTKLFKKCVGVTPSKYRKMISEDCQKNTKTS